MAGAKADPQMPVTAGDHVIQSNVHGIEIIHYSVYISDSWE